MYILPHMPIAIWRLLIIDWNDKIIECSDVLIKRFVVCISELGWETNFIFAAFLCISLLYNVPDFRVARIFRSPKPSDSQAYGECIRLTGTGVAAKLCNEIRPIREAVRVTHPLHIHSKSFDALLPDVSIQGWSITLTNKGLVSDCFTSELPGSTECPQHTL